MKVEEVGSATAISAYRIGVATGGAAVHRGVNPSSLAPLSVQGSYPGLTTGNDSGLPVQRVTTGTFTANAGDNTIPIK